MSLSNEFPSYIQAYADQVVASKLKDAKPFLQKRPLPTSTPLNTKTVSNTGPASDILSKTLYDPINHSPESADWLNVLLAQAILQYRDDAQANNRLVCILDESLNSGIRPDFVGPIQVTRLSLGEEYPVFSNARIKQTNTLGSLRVEIDCEYNDQITLGFDTQILINWPRPRIAVLPISLVLSVIKFSATIALEIVNHTQSSYIALSALPGFTLEFDVQSLIGSRSKLEGVPKVTHLITSKLRNLFIERFVFPNYKKLVIPDLLGSKLAAFQPEIQEVTGKSSSSTSTTQSSDNLKLKEGERDNCTEKEKHTLDSVGIGQNERHSTASATPLNTRSSRDGLRARSSLGSDYLSSHDSVFYPSETSFTPSKGSKLGSAAFGSTGKNGHYTT
ncbi:hypothetical protein G9A89_016213 [Geosiphon pyriformis]|nr:hypothetical protein G9A89_016213 [Geosiphon pyriformis]